MICSMCNQDLTEDNFSFKNKSKQIRSASCKKCHSIYSKQHYKDNRDKYLNKAQKRGKIERTKFRQFITEYKKGRQCLICKESDSHCLVFHHLDPSIKEHSISTMNSQSKKKLLLEMDKCVILCANCHCKVHYGNLQLPSS